MSNPSIGFIIIRGGIVESAPADLPIFDMDVLASDSIGPEVIAEVVVLRDAIAAETTAHEDGSEDFEYLTSLLAECNTWLNRHNVEPADSTNEN